MKKWDRISQQGSRSVQPMRKAHANLWGLGGSIRVDRGESIRRGEEVRCEAKSGDRLAGHQEITLPS
jgi:hypothetical protein